VASNNPPPILHHGVLMRGDCLVIGTGRLCRRIPRELAHTLERRNGSRRGGFGAARRSMARLNEGRRTHRARIRPINIGPCVPRPAGRNPRSVALSLRPKEHHLPNAQAPGRVQPPTEPGPSCPTTCSKTTICDLPSSACREALFPRSHSLWVGGTRVSAVLPTRIRAC